MSSKSQKKSHKRVTSTASYRSGGHGIRTHNRFRGTTFPVWLLANSLTLRGNALGSIVTGRGARLKVEGCVWKLKGKGTAATSDFCGDVVLLKTPPQGFEQHAHNGATV